jgi:hypothetical protein
VSAFGFGLLVCVAGIAYVVFREGAGWYSRHHYTTSIGLAFMHGALVCIIAGKGGSTIRRALAAILLAAVMVPMLVANIRGARAVAIWGDNLAVMRQDMLRLAPNPAPGTESSSWATSWIERVGRSRTAEPGFRESGIAARASRAEWATAPCGSCRRPTAGIGWR